MTRNFTRPALLAAATIGFAAFFTTQPAAAACFDSGVGCSDSEVMSELTLQQLSCDSLWTVRNMIFDENGYCFKTAKAKSIFSNDGCSFTTMASMPLNSYETKNIQLVQAVEKQKACH